MCSNIGLILEVYIYYERKVQGGEYGRRLLLKFKRRKTSEVGMTTFI